MNAMQVQIRHEMFCMARRRGFHFDSVEVASAGVFMSVQAWCGEKAAVLYIPFRRLLDSRQRQHFSEVLCGQIISRDEVMTREEIIDRRNEGAFINLRHRLR